MWRKINRVNDWGKIILVAGPIVKSAYGTVSISNQTSPRIIPGTQLFKWKDGTVEYLEVINESYYETVSDHGKNSTVKSQIQCAIINHHGSNYFEVLDHLDIKIWVEKEDIEQGFVAPYVEV